MSTSIIPGSFEEKWYCIGVAEGSDMNPYAPHEKLWETPVFLLLRNSISFHDRNASLSAASHDLPYHAKLSQVPVYKDAGRLKLSSGLYRSVSISIAHRINQIRLHLPLTCSPLTPPVPLPGPVPTLHTLSPPPRPSRAGTREHLSPGRMPVAKVQDRSILKATTTPRSVATR